MDLATNRTKQLSAIGFTMVVPTIVTLVYFVILKKQPASLQQIAYGIGKTIQFGFPLLWVWLCFRSEINWTPKNLTGIRTGIAFGLVVGIAMYGLYHGWLKHTESFTVFRTNIEAKIQELGLQSVWAYAAVGVFYALCHSFMEEYYWRWFVFGQLLKWVSFSKAVFISSLGFMAHHVVLLAVYFGWTHPYTYLFSAGVAIGGAFWAWLYRSSTSLLGPWASHLLVDAAIFIVGYDIAF